MIFLVTILLFINVTLASENKSTDDYQFRQFTIKEGLSQSAVLSIIQDKKGFLWFGTANGLNRFDGYNFITYLHKPGDATSISDNEVTSIFEDKDGYLWIGTIKGVLNKFDRKTEIFEYFYPDSSSKIKSNTNETFIRYPISFIRNDNNSITSIAEDKNGNLWIGTWGNGLYCFNKRIKKFEHYFNDPKNHLSLSNNRITKIIVDYKSVIWVGTFGGGLNRIAKIQDGKSETKYHYGFINYKSTENKFSISSNFILSIFEDKRNNLWVGTYEGGLNKLTDSQKFSKIQETKFQRYFSSKDSSVFPYKTILTIVDGEENNIWLGTLGGGLVQFNPVSNSILNFRHNPMDANSISDNDVIILQRDRSGILWIGTSLGNGINQLQINRKKFNHIKQSQDKNGLSDNVIWSITEDKKGNVWIGTYRGGLNRYDKKKKEIISFVNNKRDPYSIPDNHIRSLAVDKHNNLWVGSYENGLSAYNEETENFIQLDKNGINEKTLGSKQITDIYIEKDSIFWVTAYGGGLIKFVFNSKDKLKLKRYVHDPNNKASLSDDRTYTIFEDKSGMLWIGTFGGGLNRFDKRTEKFTNFRNAPDDPFSLSEDRVINIFEDSEGVMWIGTYGGGLNKFDRELNRFTRITEEEGLTSYVVYGILEDENKNLWMSTNNGIYKYSRNERIFTQYDLSDGVQSLEFNGGAYYKTSDGEIYFGGINGVNSFYPDSIKHISYIPNIVISSFKVLNNPIKGERKNIELSYTENFFSLEFASLDYSNPEDCRYAYMLEGFDEEWRYTNARQRVAMYTNLASGDYVFKVIGSNSDGIWNYEGVTIKLTILPPFWRTWWFITGCILLFLLGIYFVSTLRIRNLLAIEKLKTKLAADLHDNVGSGLTEISILSELVSREVHNGANNVSQNLKSISETSRYLIDNMSDIVWVVNPRRDSLHDLIIRLKDSYNDVLAYKGISLKTTNLDKLENIKLPMEYRQNLYLIFKEGINNSLKHSKCNQIYLEANVRGDILEMILKDNGVGLPIENNTIGNGVRNMKERSRIIGGKLKWKSAANSGTTISFVGKINGANKLFYLVKRFLNASN